MAGSLRDVESRPEDNSVQLTDYVDESNVCHNERPSVRDSSWQAAQSLPNQALKTVLSRSYPIGSITWDSGGSVGDNLTVLGVVNTLTALPQIAEKLQWFEYFRFSGVELSIRVNATPFHYGYFTISALPETSPNTSLRFSAFNNNPVIVSASQADVVNYTVDWCWPQKWGRTTVDGTGVNVDVTYYLTKLTQIRLAGDSFRPANISLFARFIDPEVTFPRIASSAIQLGHVQGKEGKAKANSSQESGGDDSFLNSIVQTVSSIANVASIAAPLVALLDKPINESTQSLVSIMPGRDMAITEGVDNSAPLGRAIDNRISNEPIMSDNPCATAEEIARVPSYFRSFTFDNTVAYGDTIDTWAASPYLIYRDATSAYPTFLCWATLPFYFWRGSIKYALYFACSTFVTARIRVSWIPEGSTFDHEYAGDVISKVYDITGDTTVHFTVPWINDAPFRGDNIGFDSVIKGTGPLGPYNGNIVVSMENVITSAQSTATIECACFVAGAEDYQLGAYGHDFSTSDETLRPVVQSCVWEEFDQAFDPIVDDSTYTTYRKLTHPEDSNSILDLMKRYQTFDYEPDGDGNFYLVSPGLGNNELPGAIIPSGSGNRISTVLYWSCLYEFWRGSRRYKCFYTAPHNTVSEVIPTVDAFSQTEPSDLVFGSSFRPRIVTSSAIGTSQYLEFEMPYFNSFPYSTVFPVMHSVSATPFRNISVKVPNSTDPGYRQIFAGSIGDDYQLGWLRSPPPFVWDLPPLDTSPGSKGKLRPPSKARAQE